MASLKSRLFAAASQFAELQALLTNGSMFQWADQQLPQSWNLTSCNAVAVNVISNPKDYVTSGPMVTSFSRVQFTIFGFGTDSTQADAVAAALFDFIQTFNASQVGSVSPGVPAPNYVLNDRDSGFAETDPMTYQRIIDVRVFANDQF